jgi:hypothetical protein
MGKPARWAGFSHDHAVTAPEPDEDARGAEPSSITHVIDKAAHPAIRAVDKQAMTVNLESAARVAARWLQMDAADAVVRACIVLDVDAVYLRADNGWAALVGNDLRPLMGEPGHSLAALVGGFAAGFRTNRRRGVA